MKTKRLKENNEADAPPLFLKASAIGKRFGLSGKTIQRWGSAGLVHPRKVNARTVLFNLEEVTNFVESAKI